GRSAASLVEFDPIPAVQALKAIGGKFLRNPPAGFADNPILIPTPVMLLFRRPVLSVFDFSADGLRRDGVAFQPLSCAESKARVPALLLEEPERALMLTACGRIDVHELLTRYLRHA